LSVKSKVLTAGAVLAVLGGTGAAGVLPASASSPGCAFTNGCATLHGFDAASHAVAMDAKYQNPKEIVIGYPDVPGDGATSFDGVLHYTKGAKKTTYQDTGLDVREFDNTCHVPASHDVTPAVSANPAAAGTITAGGNTLAVSTGVSDLSVSGGGTGTLNWTGVGTSGPKSLIVAETYGAGCVSLWGTDVTAAGGVAHFLGFSPLASSAGGHIHETDTGSSAATFTDSVSGGTFTFTALPAGVSQSGGILTANTSTAVPGTYTSVGVVYTQPGGVINTASFTLVVSGIKSAGRGNDIPFYTFAYAKGGVWTNQCVTDEAGSGALNLQACTLGKDRYQDFFIEAASGGAPVLLGGGSYFVQDELAAVTDPASSCLTDPSSLTPQTPQSDATDELSSPAGRQLRVDGSCSATADQWAWGS
jgi:hypothetical protein